MKPGATFFLIRSMQHYHFFVCAQLQTTHGTSITHHGIDIFPFEFWWVEAFWRFMRHGRVKPSTVGIDQFTHFSIDIRAINFLEAYPQTSVIGFPCALSEARLVSWSGLNFSVEKLVLTVNGSEFVLSIYIVILVQIVLIPIPQVERMM